MLAEIKRIYDREDQYDCGGLTLAQRNWMFDTLIRYREALENIHAQSGPVCAYFEICNHAVCTASAGAHLIALEALKDAEPGSN